MANDIKQTLKEGTDGVLSEEVLNEIEQVFNEAVEERSTLRVEAALVQQDDDHAGKVQQLLEAIDTDHTAKMKRIVKAVNENHAHKLKLILTKFNNDLNCEAAGFKNSLVENVSNYLDLYLEETFPADTLQEAVNNKRANSVLSEMRKMLAVDMAMSKDSIKEAVKDGKIQIDEANSQLETVTSENSQLRGALTEVKATLLLDKMSQDLPEVKKNYINRVLGDKDEQFITENFNYTLQLFDKEAERKTEEMAKEARKDVRGKVDPVITEQVDVVNEPAVQPDKPAPIFNQYMGELGKY
tara:strand:- start:43 stop:936 length:894 start_codon:yes stop_codon:yes gene_type:complete